MSHRVTRRGFLRIGAASLAGAVLSGCEKPRRWVNLEPYVRPPEEQLAGVATWYASTCRQCPAGCGIVVRVMNGRALKIEGNPEHPLNRGKLCARGQAGLQLLYNPDRLSGPVQQVGRGSRQFRALSWDAALNTVYAKVQEAGTGVAMWAGSTMSGHLYDLFQRFAAATGAPAPVVHDLYTAMSGYRVLKDSSRELVGHSALPAYDLAHADVILAFGADFLGTGLSSVRYGQEFGAFRGQSLGKRGYLVQLAPRMSTTGAVADRWLAVRPGSEALVAQALIRIIADESLGSEERVARARAVAGDVEVDQIATDSDVPIEELRRLAHLFGTADRPVAIPGGALTGQENALETTAMVQTLNVIAGTADQAGGWFTSQETLPVALARPEVAPMSDVYGLIERMRADEIRVLLVHSANPAYDLPSQAGFLEALDRVPFVVSFSPIVDETAAWADLVLPDRTYLESWGYEVVSPSFGLPIVGSQQPVVEPVFDARSTGDVLLTIARGIAAAAQALPWADEVAFLKDAIGQLGAGAAGGSGPEVLWVRFLQHGGWWPTTASAAARQPAQARKAIEVASPQFQGDEQEYPFFLHPYLSALLGDGRGASQPWLQGSPDPMTTLSWQTWVELAPETAQKLGVGDGDVVRVTSPHGELEAPVYIYPAIRPDTVAIPVGQGHTDCGRYARDRGSNLMRLIGTETDATGSNLAWATVRVKVARTDKRVALASFENRVGVREGFINQASPG
jgi:anaerobic selenocysteine-containing dehydrogenase